MVSFEEKGLGPPGASPAARSSGAAPELRIVDGELRGRTFDIVTLRADGSVYVACDVIKDYAQQFAAAPELLAEAREICAILDLYRADTGEEPCFDHEAIGEEVARRHESLTAAIAKATGQEFTVSGDGGSRTATKAGSGMNPK